MGQQTSMRSAAKRPSENTMNTNIMELSQSLVSHENEDILHIQESQGPLDDVTRQRVLTQLKDLRSTRTGFGDDIKYQNEQLLDDVNTLVQQNFELNQALNNMNDEINYLKLREKKLKYLVHLLHERGYPVHLVFSKQVQPIDTLRFDEFLLKKEQEAAIEAELDA